MNAIPSFFVIGCARSGTTLLRRLLDAHREIDVVPEIGWIARWYENGYGATPDGRVRPALIRYLIKRGSMGRYTALPVTPGELEQLIDSDRQMLYSDFVTWLFERYRELDGAQLVGHKNVDAGVHVASFHALWPHAKFVHLIRDGRDVSLSAMAWKRAPKLKSRFQTWHDDPVTTSALWWEWYVRMGREAGEILGPDLYYETKYENVVNATADECAALCAFLGVAYDERMLRFHEGREKTDPGLDAKTAWRPPTRGLRDWRSQMARDDLEYWEAAAGDLLDELGYKRGTDGASAETLEHVALVRAAFDGRPLPRRWG